MNVLFITTCTKSTFLKEDLLCFFKGLKSYKAKNHSKRCYSLYRCALFQNSPL